MSVLKKFDESQRVVMIGNSSVGKTSLLGRLCGDGFDPDLPPTVGAAWVQYMHEFRGSTISLEIWDTAGQEAYRTLGPLYYRSAVAAMIVYDVSNRESFASLKKWATEFVNVAGSETVIFVIGNKSDLPRAVLDSEATEFAQSEGYEWFATSAITGEGVSEAFGAIAERIAISTKRVDRHGGPVPLERGGEAKSCC